MAEPSPPPLPKQLWFYERWACRLLRSGPVPKHLAFIMDGNRRYAKQRHLPRQQGHEKGLDSLKKALEFCLELGVEQVSTYAFSIQNFNRQAQEVDQLMQLAQTELLSMAQQHQFLDRHGIKVIIVGDLSLLPPLVQQAMQQVMHLTQHHLRLRLNICFAYNSTWEIQNAIQHMPKHIPPHSLSPEQWISLFEQQLTISNPPDLLVRTSNERRLSDFLTYQSSNSILVFLKENWPELSLWSFLCILHRFQRDHLAQKQHHPIQTQHHPPPSHPSSTPSQ